MVISTVPLAARTNFVVNFVLARRSPRTSDENRSITRTIVVLGTRSALEWPIALPVEREIKKIERHRGRAMIVSVERASRCPVTFSPSFPRDRGVLGPVASRCVRTRRLLAGLFREAWKL